MPWQVFPNGAGTLTVAALPQPFSCRRWQLVAANGEEVRQTFVQLPYAAILGAGTQPEAPARLQVPAEQSCRVPDAAYRPPQDLEVQIWTGRPEPDLSSRPEAREILEQYLEFARFPCCTARNPGGPGRCWSGWTCASACRAGASPLSFNSTWMPRGEWRAGVWGAAAGNNAGGPPVQVPAGPGV